MIFACVFAVRGDSFHGSSLPRDAFCHGNENKVHLPGIAFARRACKSVGVLVRGDRLLLLDAPAFVRLSSEPELEGSALGIGLVGEVVTVERVAIEGGFLHVDVFRYRQGKGLRAEVAGTRRDHR